MQARCKVVSGQVGNAAKFNGDNQYIQIYNNPALDIGPAVAHAEPWDCDPASRTDWQIVRDGLNRNPYQVRFHVQRTNPPVKDRVNCVNALLRNRAGQQRLLVDPSCRELIRDFERVHWKSDPHGNAVAEIDKSDPLRSHLSDAVGYMIAKEFAMRAKIGEMPGRIL